MNGLGWRGTGCKVGFSGANRAGLGHLEESHVTDGVRVGKITDPARSPFVGHVADELAANQAGTRIVGVFFGYLPFAQDPGASFENRLFVAGQPGTIIGQAGVLGHGPFQPADFPLLPESVKRNHSLVSVPGLPEAGRWFSGKTAHYRSHLGRGSRSADRKKDQDNQGDRSNGFHGFS
jgi:hypothetical protein